MTAAEIADETSNLHLELETFMGSCTGGASAQLQVIANEIERAQGLVSESLAQLREDVEQLMPLVPQQGRQHLDRAIVALQSEDAAGQLLAHVRHRTHELNRLLQRLGAINWLMARGTSRSAEANGVHWMCRELRELSGQMQAMGFMHQPVAQRAVACGPAELF